ncbi:ribosome small subunit-dependent GTPase A [Hoeflea prorocentri]|uniref:Small ribosomal subunit biogenesis GTPase RsgA n=2 Tax=Hoeflea prorocentri TaxID=1922333 RepID=A0A9X3UN60_9HYPH|nr:ribosome small subunit-dependent GTPase A [Hoeflea prorocentri]MCY6383621.1 ribosome small subunit-dependent GTPase A [Hoeflea prorocentri]MDA5401421.1 ribosome small subunit-dependent GTPase A [Hoeflea prorocentri]
MGWQPFFEQQISVDELARTPPVRVVEVHRNGLHVIGEHIDKMIQPRADVTVGDWLLLDSDHPLSSRHLERRSLLKRRAPGTDRQVQLIAANVDTIFIVSSCNQDFNIARLERYIALAFEADISPVIVLTKADLVSDVQAYVDQARAISDLVPVVTLDARDHEPREKLAQWCKPGSTVAFVGSSGVGKSTLTNALAGNQSIETQTIREDDAKGRHTTTRRQLHPVPGDVLVLDTPGMRELQLTDAASGIDNVFADLHDLSVRCRFKDCRHETEPGCAVLRAVENGEIDAARLGRWRKLQAEEAHNSASLAERRSKDKAFGKMVRQVKKIKDQKDPER